MSKHIYIYSPSGAVRDKSAFKRGVRRLEAMGHQVEVDEAALASAQRFAGDDATRVQAIHRAASSGADVALISRGGYGITRILGDINYKLLHKAVKHGTQFVGLSDFSALQLALIAKTGTVTWAGPALCEGFGVGPVEPPDDIMLDCFNDFLVGQAEGAGWRLGPGMDQQKVAFHIKNATLWGGNLSVLCSLVGTPYCPKTKGGILFLEDIAEHPYRVERMLTQLLNAGVLKAQKAILLGQFTEYRLTSHDKGYKFQTVVDWLRSKVNIPVLTNLPFGHVQTKVLLPVGAKVDLVVEGRDSLILWGHEI